MMVQIFRGEFEGWERLVRFDGRLRMACVEHLTGNINDGVKGSVK